jgi:hypothetical protein
MLLVLAAFLADWRKLCAPRFLALALAKRDNAVCDAASEPSLRNASSVARVHLLEGFRIALRLARACIAFPLLFLPLAGILIPARRALDKPIAINCFVNRAPCAPCRMWSISSLTNSPLLWKAIPPLFCPPRLCRAYVFLAFRILLALILGNRNGGFLQVGNSIRK